MKKAQDEPNVPIGAGSIKTGSGQSVMFDPLKDAEIIAGQQAQQMIFDQAIVILLHRGHTISRSDIIPGLWEVSGYPELTANQLVAEAFKPPPNKRQVTQRPSSVKS